MTYNSKNKCINNNRGKKFKGTTAWLLGVHTLKLMLLKYLLIYFKASVIFGQSLSDSTVQKSSFFSEKSLL